MSQLVVSDLRVSYGGVHAVHGVSLSINDGETVALVGANGAGKSSTLNAIAGAVRPAAGSVQWAGREIGGLGAHKIARSRLVLVPEGRKVFAPLSVEENLRLGAYAAGRRVRVGERLELVFDTFPVLKERRGGKAGLLSGGEQQMLAFGRALMSDPLLMLLDEPSMGLAPAVIDIVMAKIAEIAKTGVGILMVEQNLHAALRVASTLMVMAQGEITYRDTVEAARRDPGAIEAFFGQAAVRT